MDFFKKYFQNTLLLHIAIIVIFIIILSLFTSNHFYLIFQDHGREYLLPSEILNGKTLYKDITLIYFPLAYYINALIYKALGVSINSLLISQTFFCSIYAVIYYLCAKEFFNKRLALCSSLLIISCCIFSFNELFSYINPYSYATVYGLMGFLVCTYGLIKLYRTENLKYAYLAGCFAGFCASCKFEFIVVYFLLFVSLFLYKKLAPIKYLKIILCSLLFPVITVSILFLNGVTIQDINQAVTFGIQFSKTDVMFRFLSEIGLYPTSLSYKIIPYTLHFLYFILIVMLCFVGLVTNNKYKKWYILPIISFLMWHFLYNKIELANCWVFLPFFILGFACIKIKSLAKNDKVLIILVTASLLCSIRAFFYLNLAMYGTFGFPLLLLSMCALLNKYITQIKNISIDSILCFVLIIFIGFYLRILSDKTFKTNYAIKTDRGTIYTHPDVGKLLDKTLTYMNNITNESSTVLVLPEGNMINFLAQKNVNMKCYMMDRLYHDAYGDKNAEKAIADTNSDYILLVQGLGLSNFMRPYLYEKNNSSSFKYIRKNYALVKHYINQSGIIIILKKKHN